jgi:hypothetical protein
VRDRRVELVIFAIDPDSDYSGCNLKERESGSSTLGGATSNSTFLRLLGLAKVLAFKSLSGIIPFQRGARRPRIVYPFLYLRLFMGISYTAEG